MIRVLHRDPYDADDLSEAEIEGRKRVQDYIPFLKTLPGLEKSFLIDIAPHIGVRDSRRIVGEHTLTREDIVEARTFDDQIYLRYHRGKAAAGWIMHPADGSNASEIHRDKYQKAEILTVIFGIPYRCLVPLEIDGLLVAGKTVSMDYEAHTRCRSIPDCMAFGQAAGVAAALAARDEIAPRRVDPQVLRKLLIERGANIRQGVVEMAKVKPRGAQA